MKVYGMGVVPVLGYRVDVLKLDGEMSLVHAIDQTPDGGVSYRGASSGRPVHTEHFPKRMRWCGPTTPPIPDFNQAYFMNVSARAREVIEQVEPGVHQFVPVTFVDKKDVVIEERYFWVICNRIDSMDHDRTSFVLIDGKFWRPLSDARRSYPDQIPARLANVTESRKAFNPAAIGNAQAWRDKHWDLGMFFLSQAFVDAATTAGLTGVRFSEFRGI